MDNTVLIIFIIIIVLYLILIIYFSSFIADAFKINIVIVVIIGIFIWPLWLGLLIAALIVGKKSGGKSSPLVPGVSISPKSNIKSNIKSSSPKKKLSKKVKAKSS